MKALIIEDEENIAEHLTRILSEVAPNIEILDIISTVKGAKRWFMQNAEPDLIFMDIQLADGISFEIFEHFQLKCPVIFTTAYDEYAVRAFKVNGIDYLLKPIDEDDLIQSLEKLKNLILPNNLPLELLQTLTNRNTNTVGQYKEKFVVAYRNTSVPVNVADIAAFSLDELIYLVKFDKQRFITDFTSLDQVEDLLNPWDFFRANRRQIINVNSIENYKGDSTGKLYVKVKTFPTDLVEISREKAPGFKKWLDR